MIEAKCQYRESVCVSGRPEHFSGRTQKNYVISGQKILPMTIPLGASGLNFRAGLGQAARAFYSVKQLKTAFRVGLEPKKNRELQDLCPRLSSKVRARARLGPGQRAGSGRAQNAQV
jgi:hypothetical protein